METTILTKQGKHMPIEISIIIVSLSYIVGLGMLIELIRSQVSGGSFSFPISMVSSSFILGTIIVLVLAILIAPPIV